MPKSRKPKEEDQGPLEAETPAPKASKPKARPIIPAIPKRLSFTVWATMRGIKDSHRPGMRAFITNPNQSRPLSVWDSLFKDY